MCPRRLHSLIRAALPFWGELAGATSLQGLLGLRSCYGAPGYRTACAAFTRGLEVVHKIGEIKVGRAISKWTCSAGPLTFEDDLLTPLQRASAIFLNRALLSYEFAAVHAFWWGSQLSFLKPSAERVSLAKQQ